MGVETSPAPKWPWREIARRDGGRALEPGGALNR